MSLTSHLPKVSNSTRHLGLGVHNGHLHPRGHLGALHDPNAVGGAPLQERNSVHTEGTLVNVDNGGFRLVGTLDSGTTGGRQRKEESPINTLI